VDLDQKTRKGTALHLACRLNKATYVNALIIAGCDCDVKNADGYMPVDLTSNEHIIDLFKFKFEQDLKNKKDSEIPHLNFADIPSEQKTPEKPPVIKGDMFKIGNLGLTLNQRFFVLNAEEGTLIRFKKREDFPLKPKFF